MNNELLFKCKETVAKNVGYGSWKEYQDAILQNLNSAGLIQLMVAMETAAELYGEKTFNKGYSQGEKDATTQDWPDGDIIGY